MHLLGRAIAGRIIWMEKSAHIRIDPIDVEPIAHIHIARTPQLPIVIVGPINDPSILRYSERSNLLHPLSV